MPADPQKQRHRSSSAAGSSGSSSSAHSPPHQTRPHSQLSAYISSQAGAQPKRTVVGFSPTSQNDTQPTIQQPAASQSHRNSISKSFGAVQDIRPKSSNADAVVSSQLASSSERSSVASASSSYGAPTASIQRNRQSFSHAAPLGSSASAAISASVLRVGSPSRKSFEDRLFSEEFQNKTKIQNQLSDLALQTESLTFSPRTSDTAAKLSTQSSTIEEIDSNEPIHVGTTGTAGNSASNSNENLSNAPFESQPAVADNFHKSGSQQTAHSANAASDGQPRRKSQKEMTKAERRELQERQRAEKKAREAAGLPKPNRGGQQKQQQSKQKQPSHSAQMQSGSLQQSQNNQGSSQQHQSQSNPSQTAAANQQSVSESMRMTSPISVGQRSAGGGHSRHEDVKRRARAEKAAAISRRPLDKIVPLFSHLAQYEPDGTIYAESRSRGLVHPAVLCLGIHFSEFVISGGNARCLAMLLAFKKVIADYTTPAGTSLQRHLTQHIGKQVDFLSNVRSLCTSMKVAIRFLKNEISMLSIDLPDEDAKQLLCKNIEMFISQRIEYADDMILNEVLSTDKIKDGDVILTFARSSVVLKLLLKAHSSGIQFRVIVADGRPKFEGKETLRELLNAGVNCTYVLTNALPFVMKEATKVVIGASAVLSNGAIMSRVGTSVVSMMAHEAKVPVMVLCETLKFSDTVRLDSFVWNELGNPDDLVDISNRSTSERLPHAIPSPDKSADARRMGAARAWRDVDALKLLNLYYDITPARFVNMVVCEFGQIPSTSVLSVLREPMPNEYMMK